MSRVNVFGKQIVYDVGPTQENTPLTGDRDVLEGDDLSKFTKTQTTEFLKEQTHKSNFYAIDSTIKEISLTDASGNPVSPSTQISNNDAFSKDFAKDQSYSNTNGATFFEKGKAEKDFNGNKLLQSVTSPNDTSIVPKYTSPILNKNRFTSDRQQEPTKNLRINPDHPQETLGNNKEYTSTKAGKDFSDGHLAHIGASLGLRASREVLASSRTGYGPDGPDGVGAIAASLLPGLTQAGVTKVSMSDLEVKDVLNQIIAADTTPANLDPNATFGNHTVLQINDSSWGQMNNVLEPFSGILPLGMLGLSVALTLALKVAMSKFLVIFSTITSAGKSQTTRVDSTGHRIPGSYVIQQGENKSLLPIPLPASMFGIRLTVHEFNKCVDRGMEEFFGGKITDTSSTLKRILESPGFYAVFCRSIVRSTSQILTAIKNAIKGNPVQIAQNIIALVEVIKSSKIISALNMFATIGDAALTYEDSPAYKNLSDKSIANTRYSIIDQLSDDSSTGYKSRLKDGTTAWKTSNSPSAFLFPKAFMSSLSQISQLQNGNSIYSDKLPSMVKRSKNQTTDKIITNGIRLDSELVKAVETELDAEYMPFYFHDLRTNEIISFPAFLSSLSDDFTVNYETGEYYGRIDQVKIYKSTQRKIGISFIIAATNDDDFDQMWFKINKLVTMVYPQWTEGTTLNNKGDNVKMIQPFSQLPGASPLIRIRLGDLLRSNYSKFALARLFGVGTNNFKIDNSITSDNPDFAAILTKLEEIYKDPRMAKKGTQYILSPGFYPSINSSGASKDAISNVMPPVASVLGGNSGEPSPTFNISQPIKVAFIGLDKNQNIIVDVVDSKVKDSLMITNSLVVTTNNLSLDKVALESRVQMYADNKNLSQINADVLTNFLDANNNSIVRSFESVGGKGLACQIDSMNMGWLDQIPWETAKYGSRAPKMCKISIALTPIHDIAPGIDSSGFNRAPVYNVGDVVRKFGGDSWDEQQKGRGSFDKLWSDVSAKTKLGG